MPRPTFRLRRGGGGNAGSPPVGNVTIAPGHTTATLHSAGNVDRIGRVNGAVNINGMDIDVVVTISSSNLAALLSDPNSTPLFGDNGALIIDGNALSAVSTGGGDPADIHDGKLRDYNDGRKVYVHDDAPVALSANGLDFVAFGHPYGHHAGNRLPTGSYEYNGYGVVGRNGVDGVVDMDFLMRFTLTSGDSVDLDSLSVRNQAMGQVSGILDGADTVTLNALDGVFSGTISTVLGNANLPITNPSSASDMAVYGQLHGDANGVSGALYGDRDGGIYGVFVGGGGAQP